MRGISEIAAIILNRSTRWEWAVFLTPRPFYPRHRTPNTNWIETGVGTRRRDPSPGTEPRFLIWPTGNLGAIPDPDIEINKPNLNCITAASASGRPILMKGQKQRMYCTLLRVSRIPWCRIAVCRLKYFLVVCKLLAHAGNKMVLFTVRLWRQRHNGVSWIVKRK